MYTVNLSEFNQNPARIRRLADQGEVLVLRRGVPGYRITKIIPESHDPLELHRRQGRLLPSRNGQVRRSTPLPSVSTDLDLGAMLDADRGRLDA